MSGRARNTTINDKKVADAKDLFVATECLVELGKVLDKQVATISDSNASRRQMNIVLKQMRQGVKPMVEVAAMKMRAAANVLSPIANLEYAVRRGKGKRKSSSIDPRCKMSIEGQSIFNYLEECKMKVSMKGGGSSNKSQPTKHNSSQKRNAPSADNPQSEMTLPPPASGRGCNKLEVVRILEPTAKKSKARSALVSAIIDHQAKFDVPCQLRAIQTLMQDHSDGKVILPVEFKKGTSSVANDEEVVEMAKSLATFKNRVITRDVIREKLNELRRKKLEDAGIAVLNDIEVSESTVNNYRALLCCDGDLSIVSSFIDKTNNRFIAENSIRAAISTAFIVGATHLLHVEEYDAATQKELKELPPKITALLKMVSDEWGKCLIPIAPYYIYSTDD
ncbi:hypothetical protein ACHAWU_004214 [Discostella pseudostelligera]|uniref:Uncharacterized protein n=1 Tax=Discostella pseudostelligera TaxID=259834 RepID=A0ABD3M2E4_9STRA